MVYVFHIPATFAFDVTANSEEEAKIEAKRLLDKFNPVEDDGAIAGVFRAPWVEVAGKDIGFPELRTADEYPEK